MLGTAISPRAAKSYIAARRCCGSLARKSSSSRGVSAAGGATVRSLRGAPRSQFQSDVQAWGRSWGVNKPSGVCHAGSR